MSLADTAAGAEIQANENKLRAAWAEERKQLEQEQREALAAHDRDAQQEIAAAKAELEAKVQRSNQDFERLEASTSDLRDQIRRHWRIASSSSSSRRTLRKRRKSLTESIIPGTLDMTNFEMQGSSVFFMRSTMVLALIA
jgi:dsDNA-specific endonuclease/ATPase MutS2